MTKRIEKKRLKRKHKALKIAAAMHLKAADSWQKVEAFAENYHILTGESPHEKMVRGIMEEKSKEAYTMTLVELVKSTECIASVQYMEKMRGKWIPRRWAA